MEIDQPGNFICRFCKGSFTQAHHLHKHVQLIHTANPSTKTNRTCPICGTVFAKYEGYRTHLRHIHGQRNEGQIFAFKCFNDFFLWKTELESRSSCKYSLNGAPKLLPSNEKIHVYQCDGNNCANKKKKGSCSSIDNCAAMICATESLKNHEIKVEYWNTHVGHIVAVEEDELNAAIDSVQSSEEPTMHVMDMLNSIDQSIETGAEVFVTETIEEDNSLSPVHKKNQNNIFNIKKAKSSAVKTTKPPPIVQNFSFKKDPSKKKESSIYSLASVACGKISANKAVKQSSIRTNIPKSIASNSVSGLNNIVNSLSDLAEDDTLDHVDRVPKSSLRNMMVGQHASQNPSSSAKSKKQIVYNWPVGKPLPTDWIVSDPPPSGEKSFKNTTEKENLSSISNKIIVPLASENNKSKQEKPTAKAAKPKTPKANNPTSKTKSTSKQVSSASAKVTANTTQIAQSSRPLSTPHTHQIINSIPNFTPNPLIPSVLPNTQTFISVNNKLIPIVNTSIPPSLSSSVLLPILPKPPAGSVLKTPAIASKEVVAPYQPSAAGGAVKHSTIGPLAGTVPTISNTFSGSQVILLPCTNSSAIPSILHPGSSTIGSPLVLQGITPVTSAPINRSNMFMSGGLLKSASVPLTQTASSVSTAKSTLAGPVSLLNSSNLSKSVKVNKVSLPAAINSTSLLNKNINSVLALSQPSQVSSVVLNSAPISSTPAINIPEASRSGIQKPGTYLFESSGELYMLEPLDDDLIVKEGSTPLTSTPKKVSNLSMHESFNKLFPSKQGESVLRQKIDKTKTSQNVSSTIGAAKKSILFPENNNSNASEFTRSVLKSRNKATIDADLNKDNLICQKAEMTIKIAPSQNMGEKEVSVFAKSPTDIRAKLAASGSSPLKYTPSLLTVKTVPSFSLHQSRPVTSTLNSFRNFTSSSLVTSSNYASSTQATSSVSGSAPSFSTEKEIKESNSSESTLLQETQNVEVKRNVTIKSVVQEKRSATDDDLEVMKKVKFYKLEMKYLACQEQCKKLKIELAKALSKNKELLQDIDGKRDNEQPKQINSDVSELVIKNPNCIESKEVTLNENKVAPDVQIKRNDDIKVDKKEISCDVEIVSSLDKAGSDGADSCNEMDFEFDDNSCNGQSETLTENDQVPAKEIDYGFSNGQSEKPMESDQVPDEELGDNSCKEKNEKPMVSDQVPAKEFDDDSCNGQSETPMESDQVPAEVFDDNSCKGQSENAMESDQVPAEVFNDDSCNGQSEKPMESDQVLQECTNTAEEKCTKEDTDCDLQQEMDAEEDEKELKDAKEPSNLRDSKDSQVKDKEHTEAKSNPNVDVFTMVRASVLKNLYLTIEDLTEEKKQLQKDLNEYQKLDLNTVPSFEECEDSL